ncbi:sodium/proline symporter PutP [Kistimonas asteriae]|uniref:sodium/proline symporter PutP n=1 Tax=Kistimonas asteriae TaxID=517724 RepID=UPI001BA6273D|nr:sodium/proline symporter PutP [Kistimonas asteriae]
MQGNTTVLITFVAYFTVMLGIGYEAYRRTATSSDYFLGGRSLGPWTAALSAGASDMSGWLLLGLPGYAFMAGLEAFWLGAGLLLGTWLNWMLVAKRLRVYSKALGDSLTLSEYFSNRFNDRSKVLQRLSAMFILLFFLFYTSSGLVAGGKLFETAFGLDYRWAVILGAVSVISYTLFGGFLAVCWTDLVQGLLMSAALIIVPLVALDISGGIGHVVTTMHMKNPELLNIMTDVYGNPLSTITILSLLGWGLGYFGQPHILARFKAIKSVEDMPAARRIAVTWTGFCILGAFLVGLAGMVYVDAHPGIILEDPEQIFMLLVSSLFNPLVAGILLAAILAAIMSTADSQLLVCSTAFAEDLYRDMFRSEANQQEVLQVGRVSVVVISIIACLLAMNPDSNVLGLVSYAWAGFGAAFGPALLISLFWKRMTRNGALAGILVGGVTVVVWKQLTGGWFDLYEIIPGFAFSSIAIVAVSLLDGCLSTHPLVDLGSADIESG